MSRPAPPWSAIALELIGYVPDQVRSGVARRRNHVKTLTSVSELDEYLAKAAELFASSDDAARRFLAGFEFAAPDLPADPFSEEYAIAQWDLYRRISGRDTYSTNNEVTQIDPAGCVEAPYPYSTGSAGQVADQLLVCGFIIRVLNPQRNQRIVEFGPGWGNLTMPLVMMSVDTTAVEVSPTFAELLRRRAGGNEHLTVIENDMLGFTTQKPFDAAVFFESFHHCSDHLEMLAHLHSIVANDGAVIFAAEPITHMPYPWGLRLDGLSLWSTRTYGWLELGFDNHYFQQALERTGWKTVQRRRSRSMTPLADVIMARR